MVPSALIIGLVLLAQGVAFLPKARRDFAGTMRRGAGLLRMASGGNSNIVIVGGGFGGLYTALKLDRRLREEGLGGGKTTATSPVTVTLVDPKDKFVFLPLLYELAVGSAAVVEVAPRYADLLRNTRIRFVQGSVQAIDVSTRKVSVQASEGLHDGDTREEICYDKLVLACGAQPNLSFIPGATQHALPFCTIEHAYRLRSSIKALQQSDKRVINIAVIGGGYSGVEVATTLAEYLGKRAKLTIIDRNECVMVSSSAHNRKEAERVLMEQQVDILCNASVKEVTGAGVIYTSSKDGETPDARTLDTDLVIATLGMAQSPVVTNLGLEKDRLGRVLTSRSLRSKSDVDVFALGDCSCVEGESVPSTAQAAMQQSDILVPNLLAGADDELKQFTFVPLGEMLTLGTKDAAVTSLAGLVQLDGLIASVGRRVVYALRMPTPQQSVNALVASTLVMGTNELLKFLSPSSDGKTDNTSNKK